MTSLITDTATVFSRELRPTLRNPVTIVISMVQPLVFLALFAPLLPDTGSGSALQWFVPGIVVMSCLFGASMTGSNLLYEIQTGSHERMLVTPLRRPATVRRPWRRRRGGRARSRWRPARCAPPYRSHP